MTPEELIAALRAATTEEEINAAARAYLRAAPEPAMSHVPAPPQNGGGTDPRRPGPVRTVGLLVLSVCAGAGVYLGVSSIAGGTGHDGRTPWAASPAAASSPSRPRTQIRSTARHPTPLARGAHSPSESARPDRVPRREPSTTPRGPRTPPQPRTPRPRPTSRAVAQAGTASVGRDTGGSAPGDGSPPQTSLSADFPTGRSARFLLRSDEPASFRCSLDGSPFNACTSPRTYQALKPGWHTFAVRATDLAGNTDATPARLRWHATGKPGPM